MSSRHGAEALIDRLFQESHRFDFFQAVRILEQFFSETPDQASADARAEVGRDATPSEEIVRFRTLASQSFPPSAITSIESRPANTADDSKQNPPPEMTVGFMGLTGPQGALPQHYTTLLLARIREDDFSSQEFFDLFNHRLISLFYRAWEKYRFQTGFERARADSDESDSDWFTQCLYNLIGLGHSGQRNRMQPDDRAFVYYSGHMGHLPRTAVGLERILAEYFDLEVCVEQFQQHQVELAAENCWRLPDSTNRLGLNNSLGEATVLGTRVWMVQSRFRVRLESLDYQQFRRFWPDGEFKRVQGYVAEEQRKPDPRAFLRICEELAIAPEDACMIGDTPTDLATANNAGARFLGVSWGFRTHDDLVAAGAETIVATPGEVIVALGLSESEPRL